MEMTGVEDEATLHSGSTAMRVQEIMTPTVQIADPNMTIRDAARCMRADNLGALPVGENDRLIGMVTDRDIVVRAVAEERSAGNTTVREVMSDGICYCFEDDEVEQAAQVMASHQVRRLPVLNRNKRLVGVIALADLGRPQEEAAEGALKDISAPTTNERRR
jgi:CBS domain-containing protein